MSSNSKQVTYQNYLKIPDLLSLQNPLSIEAGELAHDEDETVMLATILTMIKKRNQS